MYAYLHLPLNDVFMEIITQEIRVVINGNQNQQGNSRLPRNALFRAVHAAVCMFRFGGGAAAGFFQYNGLTLEQFLWAWLRSEVIMAGKRVWKAENYYEEAMKREVKKH